jgi:hypothetical protein
MLKDLRDQGAYRIAIAALGLAVAVVLVGISWVAAAHAGAHECRLSQSFHRCAVVPVEFWFAGGALGGVFVGALIPFTLRVRSLSPDCASKYVVDLIWGSIMGGTVLVAVCITATVLGLVENSLPLDALAATVAGVLLGLPIPSPGQRYP